MVIDILGAQRTVQPVCKCEAAAYEKSQAEAEALKTRREIERRFAISELGERFAECRFDTFTKRSGTEKTLEIALRYANHFPEFEGDGLLLWGGSGGGKSHLAAAICHRLHEQGYTTVFQTVPELLERLRSTFRQKGESEQEVMAALRDCDLLVLDDLGSEKLTEWVLDVLFRIVDGRYRRRKPIVYTTNFSLSELLQRFMPDRSRDGEIKANRLLDRIIESSIAVESKAISYRLEAARTRHGT